MRSATVVLMACALVGVSIRSVAGNPAADSLREKQFRAIPDPARMRQYMKRLSARPHHLGSPYDKQNAEWILSQFKEWGLDARIEQFDVLFPTPKDRLVELVEPTRFTAGLSEPVLAADSTSSQQSEQLPTYNAYSIDGDVTAPLVYVNYGIPEDYKILEANGITVKGAIVISRYGGAWRGIKPKVAAEHGAVGCIIYSDPREDGYYEGEVYPKGAWRPEQGVQRGSVMDMPLYPGDPLTPGIGAIPGAKRLEIKNAPTITKIPVLPISYADALPLLSALGGRVVPDAWRGALPITYHFGPGPAKVHLRVAARWETKPAFDVIGVIAGSTTPDEWVIRGNHHDAWVNGAEDPISGLVALLEEARAFGSLLRDGWRPRRSIVYCAWDGEEEGLLGSTEWAEAHAAELRRKGVAYINSDGNGRGFLGADGSHTLERLVNGVARDITDPETGLSVWNKSRLQRVLDAPSADERNKIRSQENLMIGALGSGSDFTAFVDHLGIASLNIGFGGEDGGGIYHSIYDSYAWYTRFSDTSFVYGRTLAQTAGTAIMRLADAELLPNEFTGLERAVKSYVEELRAMAKTARENTLEKNAQIAEGVFTATNDPRRPDILPVAEPVPPFINFAPLDNSLAVLSDAASRYDKAAAAFRGSGKPVPPKVNALLMECERVLSPAGGLEGRPWFKNQLYAPGFYTGYGVKTIPAVREALEMKKWSEAEEAVVRVAGILAQESKIIEQAAAALEVR